MDQDFSTPFFFFSFHFRTKKLMKKLKRLPQADSVMVIADFTFRQKTSLDLINCPRSILPGLIRYKIILICIFFPIFLKRLEHVWISAI